MLPFIQRLVQLIKILSLKFDSQFLTANNPPSYTNCKFSQQTLENTNTTWDKGMDMTDTDTKIQ